MARLTKEYLNLIEGSGVSGNIQGSKRSTSSSTIEGRINVPQENQTAVVYDIISEGPIEGLVDGTNSIFLDKTPVTIGDTKHQPIKIKNATFTASNSTLVDSDSSNPFSNLSVADGKRFIRIPKGKKSITGNGSSTGISGSEGSTIITASSSFFEPQDVSDINPLTGTDTPIDTDTPKPFIRIEGAGTNSNVPMVAPIIRFISATSVEIGHPLPRDISYKTASIDKIGTISSFTDANTAVIADLGAVGTAKINASNVEVEVFTPSIGRENTVYNYQGFQYAFMHGQRNQPYLKGFKDIGSAAVIESKNQAIEQTRDLFSSNNNTTNGAWNTTVSDATAQPVIVTDNAVANPEEVDNVKLTFKFPQMIALKSSSGDEKPGNCELRIWLGFKKTGDSAFTEKLMFGPTQDELDARDTNKKTRPWENGHNSGKVRTLTKAPFAESFVIDLTPFKPFSEYQIKIQRVDPSQGRHRDYDHTSPCTLDTVEHRFTDKLAYPNSAFATMLFDAESFAKIPSRSYEVKGLKVKVPTNYFPRGEEGRAYGEYDRNPSSGADSGSYQNWDGNFRGDISTFAKGHVNHELVWTDNPAWVFYDLVTNKRYGVGKYIDEAQVDKFELYKIARYCDELVADGKGGTEPRFTANVYIKESADALKVLKDITQIFRGMLYWLDGQIQFSQNRYQLPVYTFSKGNVTGGFSYTSPRGEFRSNQIRVTWNDPQSMYKQAVEIVEDTNNILETGKVVSKDVVAFGATSRGQAHRFGKWSLFTEILESEAVAFQSSINAGFLKPGDVILIQDADRDVISNSGRLSSSSSTTGINLDRNVDLSSGNTFKLSIMYPQGGAYLSNISATINDDTGNASVQNNYQRGDLVTHAKVDGTVVEITTDAQARNAVDSTGNALDLEWNANSRVETQTISTTGSSVSTVTVSSAFTSAPSADTMWAIREYDAAGDIVNGSAQQYVISEIKEDTNKLYTISALKYDSSKFDLVDRGYILDVGVDTNKLPSFTETPPAPETLTLDVLKSFGSGLNDESNVSGTTNKIRINWGRVLNSDGTQYQHLSHFEIKHNIDSLKGNKFKKITAPKDENYLSVEFDGPKTIIVQIQSVNINGGKSQIVQRKLEVTNDQIVNSGTQILKIPNDGKINKHIQCSSSTVSIDSKNYQLQSSDGTMYTNPSNGNTASYQQDFAGMANNSEAYLLFDASESATSGDILKAVEIKKDSTAQIPTGTSTSIPLDFEYMAEVGASNSGITQLTANSQTISGSIGDNIITGSSTAFTTDFANGDTIVIAPAGATRFYSKISYIENDGKLQIVDGLPRDYSSVTVSKLSFKPDPISDVILAKVSYDGSTYTLEEKYLEGTESLGYFHHENTSNTNALSIDAFKTQFGRFPQEGDILIVVNTAATPTASKSYKFSNNTFSEIANFMTGDLLVDGTIEGDKIRSDTQIIAGADDSNKQAVLDGTGTGDNALRIYAGANVANKANAPFKVTQGGALTATNATITGNITASTGDIGGWTIDNTSIFSGTKDVTDYTTTGITISSDSGGSIHAKEFYIDTSGNANFKGTIFGGSIRADVTNPIPTTIFTRAAPDTNIPVNNENGAFIDLESGKFVFGKADNYLSFDGTTTEVSGTVSANTLLVTDATIVGELTATKLAAGTVKVDSLAQEVWNAIGTRTGQTGGYYDSVDTETLGQTGYLGEQEYIKSLNDGGSGYEHEGEDTFLELIMNDAFSAPALFTGTAIQATAQFQFKLNSASTWTDVGSAMTLTLTSTSGQSAQHYSINFANELEISSSLTSGNYYDYRVKIVAATGSGVRNAFQQFTNYGQGGANDANGSPIIFEIREGATGVTAGDLVTNRYVTHSGDENTRISFTPDQIDFEVGGENFITLEEDTNDIIRLRKDVIMSGDLTVEGNQTIVNTATLNVEDKNITLNYGTGSTVATADGAGITIQDAVDVNNNATILWNATNDRFDFSHAIDVTGTLTSDGLTVDSGTASTTAATFSSDLSNTWLRLESGADSGVYLGSNSGKFRLLTNTTNRLAVDADGDISFYEDTGTTAKFFWDASAERLGIGATSPDYALDIRDDTNIQLKLSSTTTTNNARMTYAINNVQKWNHGVDAASTEFTFYDITTSTIPFKLEQGAASNTLMVDSNSRVGIGTNSPGQKLDVRDGTITSRDSTNTNYAELDRFTGLTLKGNGAGSRYVKTPNADNLVLGTNNLDRVTILGSGASGLGYVGINRTDPVYNLDVRGKTRLNARASDNSDATLYIVDNADDVADQNYNSIVLDYNISGSDTLATTDRTHRGMFMDIDSSASGGDQNNEHRIYGIDVDLDFNGDSDLVVGGNFHVQNNNSSGTQVTNIHGIRGFAVNNTSGTARNVNAWGGYFQAQLKHSSTQTADVNITGTRSRAFIDAGADGAGINDLTGSWSEIEIDDPGQSASVDQAYVGRFQFNNDDTSNNNVSFNDSFLVHGSYIGGAPATGNSWGLYMASTAPQNYMGGRLAIGTTNSTHKLQVHLDSTQTNIAAGHFYTDQTHSGVDNNSIVSIVSDNTGASGTTLNVRNDGTGILFNVEKGDNVEFRIQNDGKVGIGTDTPGTILEIADSLPKLRITDTRNQSFTVGDIMSSIEFDSDDASGGAGTSTEPRAAINMYADSTFGSSTGLAFYTKGDTSNYPVKQMIITSEGKVAIGTDSIQSKLTVEGDTFLSGDNRHLYFGGNNTFIGERSNSTHLELRGGGDTTQKTVYINADGSVGLGTTGPQGRLHSVGSGGTQTIRVEATDGNQASFDLKNTEGHYRIITDGGQFRVYDQTDTRQPLTINTDGQTTLGSDAATYDLKLESDAPILLISDTSASTEHKLVSNNAELRIYGDDLVSLNTNNTRRLNVADNGDIGFYEDQGVTHKMFWDASTERLGIGTTSPATGLDIETTSGIRIKQNDQINNPPGNSQNFYQGIAFINEAANTQAYSMGYGFGGQFTLNYYNGNTTYSRIMSVSNVGNLEVEGSVATGSFVLPDAAGTAGQLLKWPSSGTTLEWADDTGTTINNNANNRIITGSSTANTLEAESTLTWDGTTLNVGGNIQIPNKIIHDSDADTYISFANTDDFRIVTGNSTRAAFNNSKIHFNQEGINQDFHVQGDNVTDLLYVDASADRVGIGTSSPGEKFHVSGGVSRFQGTTSNWLEIDSTSGSGNDVTLSTRFNTLRFDVPSANDAAYDFRISDVSKMFMDGSGNVGIGTNDPQELLHLETTDPVIRIDDTNSGVHYIFGQDGDRFKFTTNNTTYGKYTFDSKVGIGTAAPDSLLHIGGVSTDKVYTGTFIEHGGVTLSRDQGNECLWVDRWGSVSTSGTITNSSNVFRPGDNYAAFSSSTGTDNPVQWTIDATFSATTNVNARRVVIFAHSGLVCDLKIEIENSSGVWETAYDDSYTFAGSRWHFFSINNVISYPADWNIQGIRVTIDNYGTSTRYIGQIGITNVKNSNTSPWITKGGGTIYDDQQLAFGNNQDFTIYHSSSDNNTYLTESGAGDLIINGSNIRLRNQGGANMIYAQSGGWVKLYHNAQERLSTSSAGIDIPTNKELRFYELSGSEYTGIKGRSSIATGDSITYQLPPSAPANSGAVLICTTAGEMTWSSNTITTYQNGDYDRVIVGAGTSGAIAQYGLTYNSSSGLVIGNMSGANPGSAVGRLTIGQSTNGVGTSEIIMDSATQGIIRFKDGSTTEASIGISPNVNNGPLDINAGNGVRLQDIYGVDTTTTTTSSTTATVIHTFAAGTFRSARITIQVKNSTDSTYHTTELLAVHDGTNVKFVEYGSIFTGDAEATFDMSIVSGNVRLVATPATTDNMTFKVVCHSITI